MADHLATLVVQSAVTKIDALAIIALAVDSPVRDARTVQPYIRLVGGERVEIEIPKFGEPPPLAIDVISSESVHAARIAALALQMTLESVTPWRMVPDFAVD